MFRRSIAAGLVAAGLAAPASAQIGGAGVGIGGPGRIGLSALAEGQAIGEVRFELRGPPEPGQDQAALEAEARRAFGFTPGMRFNTILVDAALARVRAVAGVRDAVWLVDLDAATQSLVLTLRVVPGLHAGGPSGMAAGGGLAAFPEIWRDERSLVRLLANGGVGAFSDGNPWFGQPRAFTLGNPLVQEPANGAGTGRRASWFETYAEYGIGGAARIGDSPFYVYGAVSGVAAFSSGQDIFRSDTRSTNSLEKLYAGLIYAPLDSDLSVNASVGRQNFTLNDGFLIAQYGMQWNAGPRPGIYLAPRTTTDMSALVTASYGRWVFTGFYLDPNEYEPIESNTTLVGGNLRFNVTDRIRADVTAMYVPRSDALYPVPNGPPLGREGLRTYAAHLRWADPDVLDGVWVEGEFAYQDNENFPMSAWAGYATIGYLARHLPWTPSLSYRYATFSGDDPNTVRYERFDALYSGGLNEWLQGITINKALANANRETHRIRLNVNPVGNTNITLDWFLHRALQSNNLGGTPAMSQLASRDLGQEWQLVLRTPLSQGLYFVGVASVALPGEAIRAAAGGSAKPWSSLQAQLYWTF